MLGSTGLLPDGLDGHDGQINEFFAANGSATANVGWGGMMADQLSTSGGTLPPLISLAEASVFTNGLTPSSMLLSGPPVTGFSGFDNSVASQARLAAPQAITACHCRLRLSTR